MAKGKPVKKTPDNTELVVRKFTKEESDFVQKFLKKGK